MRSFAPFCGLAFAIFCGLVFALFCGLTFALFCVHSRSFARICVFLRPTAFRATAFGNCGSEEFQKPQPLLVSKKVLQSSLYGNTPPICIALPSWLLSLEERETQQYTFHLYCNTPPICTAVLLRSARGWDHRKVPEWEHCHHGAAREHSPSTCGSASLATCMTEVGATPCARNTHMLRVTGRTCPSKPMTWGASHQIMMYSWELFVASVMDSHVHAHTHTCLYRRNPNGDGNIKSCKRRKISYDTV